MIETVLTKKQFSLKAKLTVKFLIAFGVVVLALILPRLVHLVAGAQGGVLWLPMYLPVLLGGCLLGAFWGLGIGVAAPLASFLITSVSGNPMPAAARLHFMIAELAVFASVSGLFSEKIAKNAWIAFPAVLFAEVAGRSVFMLLALIFQSVTPFTPAAVWGQIVSGMPALVLQAVIVPAIVIGIKYLTDKKRD